MSEIFFKISIFLLFITISCTPSQPESDLPNIILIYADDLGYGDLATFGATGYLTPNLDKLAAEGMRFTNFEVVQAVCSASRAGIMTGCYPNRIGIGGALNPHSKIGLNPEEETIAELVKRAGDYKSGIFGKWHLGHLKPFLPGNQGFDEYVGIPYSNDMWKWTYAMELATPETHARKASFPELPIIAGDTILKFVEDLKGQDELTTLYTHHAIRFIEENKDRPFLLCVPHSMPHVPLGVSDKFRGVSEHGLYGDVIIEIDWSVGEIVKAVEKHGLTENTLIIFTSDNGPWLNFGNHAGSTGGLREGKGTSFEGGQRVPCIMKWPDVIPAGTVCNQLASTIDLFPTFAEILQIALPDRILDGVSIFSLMKNEPGARPREIFYYYYEFDALQAVRKNNWKLVFPHKHRTYEGYEPGQDGRDGKTGVGNAHFALYDLRRDPGERYDVKDQHPEIVQELEKIAENAREDLGDKQIGRTGRNLREPGRLEQ